MARGATFEVVLTEGAEDDFESIHDYSADHDCLENADHVLRQLLDIATTLARFPERGSYPKELVALGIKEYRQAWFKPHRVVYRIVGSAVGVYLIADGRRDMQSLLARRLLGGS